MNDKNKKLDSILRAVTSIQSGLLKVSNGESRQSFQVRVTSGEDNSLHCVISDDVPPKARIPEDMRAPARAHGAFMHTRAAG